jgi:pimeloyl-ACP methyl ester carboxylesterase
MVFLTRGNGMRSAVAEAVGTAVREAAAGRDGTTGLRVTVVGHSLGGVAAVDLLARGPVPGVDTLVTVGSQAPYLYELDVLPALRYGQPLPDTFPRWVNVYDPRDALAFRAEGVFPGTPAGRVRDVMLDSHVPFPRAHSAYFSHRGLYRLLAGIDRPDRLDG